jgi:teichuronic acid biosynthesis glycosyltransferase TuaC
MQVLLITTSYPTPARPRQGAFNTALVEALRTRHDVRVVAPIPWTQSSRGTGPTSSCSRTWHPTYYYPPKILREHYHRFYWRSILSALKSLERDFSPDVVMGYWLHPDGAAAVCAAERYGVPSIVMSGGTDIRLLPREPRRRLAITRVLENCDRLVVFSRELAGHAYRLGVRPDKVDVVYRGVSRECFCQTGQAESRSACGVPPDAVVILWAGRFEDVKNPALLLHAAVRWKREWGSSLRVILAGDGPLRRHLVRLRTQLGLCDTVLFVGNLTQRQLALHLCAADLTVLTSHSEGIPNVLLESIACGTPFVATDVGGVAEIASPGIDRLVPAGNVNVLAETVIHSMRAVPAACRTFVPTDPAGMADQFDMVLARTTHVSAAVLRPAFGRTPALHVAASPQSSQEPAR